MLYTAAVHARVYLYSFALHRVRQKVAELSVPVKTALIHNDRQGELMPRRNDVTGRKQVGLDRKAHLILRSLGSANGIWSGPTWKLVGTTS